MSNEPAVAFVPPATDERELRNALGMFATGVAVVTGRAADGRYIGLTVNSFVAISLHPALVAWSLSLKAPSAAAFQSVEHFAVSILAADQIEVSRKFSRPSNDKFAGTSIRLGHHGVPVIEGAAAHFECRVDHLHVAGDHVVVIGAVEHFEYRRCNTLMFAQGRYQRCVAMELATPDFDSAWEGIA